MHVGEDGEVIGVGDNEITVWDASTGQVTAAVPLAIPVLDASGLLPVGFHPVAFGGTLVAWLGADQVVRLVDLAQSPAIVREVGPGSWPAIDRDGARLAVPGVGGEVTIYSLPDLQMIWHTPGDGYANSGDQLSGLGESAPGIDPSFPIANTIAFADDLGLVLQGRGRTLASFDAATGEPRAYTRSPDANGEFQDQPSGSLVLWPGENLVVTKGLFTVSVRDVDGLSEVARIGRPGGITSVEAVAPLVDGRMVVLDRSGDVVIVDLADNIVEPAVNVDIGPATNLAVSRDGQHLYVSGERGVATVALDGSTLVSSTIGRPEGHLYFNGAPGAAWIGAELPLTGVASRDLRPPSRLRRCPDRAAPCSEIPDSGLTPRMLVNPVESRPDLIHIYHSPPDGADAVQLLDASTFAPRSALIPKAGTGSTGWGVAPDLSWIVLDDFNPPGIVVYSTVDGHHIAEFPRHGESVQLAVHPDGTVIFVSSRLTGESWIIRTDSWEMVDSGIPEGEAAAATFSLDGKILATTDIAGRVSLRDPRTLDRLRMMDGAMGFATLVTQAFSDDGRYLLGVHGTSAVLWDTASGERIGDPMTSLPGSTPAAISGEHAIFLGVSDRWIELWHLDVDEYPSIACRAAGRNLTQAEWDELGPQDEPYHATCPQWA